jgi:hypothetical protein
MTAARYMRLYPLILDLRTGWKTDWHLSEPGETLNIRALNQDTESRDSSVGIALSYGLDDRGSRVRVPARAGNFSLHHRVQNGSGAHPASYPMGTRGSFPVGKAAGL